MKYSLEDLANKIEDFNKRQSFKKAKKKKSSNYSNLFMVSLEILSGILCGGIVGYLIDEFFSTRPLFFIICIIFGIAGSFLNIYRVMLKKRK